MKRGDGMNLLWLPHAPWHRPQRAQFFTEMLAQHHNVWVANWDGHFQGFSDLLSKRYMMNLVPRRWQESGVSIEHIPRVAPALFSRRLRAFNDSLYRRSLTRLIKREQIDVVIGCFVAPVTQLVPTVADIFDDNVGLWLAHGSNKAYAREIAEREDAWIQASEVTVTVSSVLRDQVIASHPGAEVVHIANGVDLARYKPGKQAARTALSLEKGATYIGNVGALDNHSEAERILAVALDLRAEAATKLLVVGEGAAVSYLKRRVAQERLDNIQFAGFVTGETLTHYFQALDIGLCPYQVTPADHARVPLRLLHYSAVGSTVVCTPLEEVKRMNFSNVLFSGEDIGSFVACVRRALDAKSVRPAGIDQYDVRILADKYVDVLTSAKRRQR